MKILLISVIGLGLGSLALGCDRTVSHDKVEHKNVDGTTTVDEKKVTTNDKGDVKVKTEHSVDRP